MTRSGLAGDRSPSCSLHGLVLLHGLHRAPASLAWTAASLAWTAASLAWTAASLAWTAASLAWTAASSLAWTAGPRGGALAGRRGGAFANVARSIEFAFGSGDWWGPSRSPAPRTNGTQLAPRLGRDQAPRTRLRERDRLRDWPFGMIGRILPGPPPKGSPPGAEFGRGRAVAAAVAGLAAAAEFGRGRGPVAEREEVMVMEVVAGAPSRALIEAINSSSSAFVVFFQAAPKVLFL
jgi:hypothetical protein